MATGGNTVSQKDIETIVARTDYEKKERKKIRKGSKKAVKE